MRSCLVLFAVATAALFGCGDANSTVNGGDLLFDAAPPPVPDSSSGGVDAPSGCAMGGANGGNTWADLYTCYFGPTGVANCATSVACHVSGGAGSGNWVCGTNASDCWTGIQMVIGATGPANPTMTMLWDGLRKSVPSPLNNMPLNSNFVFQPADLARISAWIQAGALGP